MRAGIVGLGTIGSAITRRLGVLGSRVAYFGPTRKSVDLAYYDDAARLAADGDMLILSCPLLPTTRHLVDAKVMEALGP